jgi:uncharacterized membrane protein SpoIIM required for sporulation
MEIVAFVESRRPRWVELERLLDKSETQGLHSLSVAEVRQLCRLYRAASGDLLWVRARSAAAEVSEYLNDLVGRAYAVTYPGKTPRPSDAWAFVSRTLPQMMRREVRMFLAATLMFWAGAGFGYVGMVFDPDAAPYLVPAEHLKLDPVKRAEEAAKDNVASADTQAAFSSFLFTHNIGVAFFCFALGLTAGIGTAILLFSNGLMLGALAQVYVAKGMAGWFWAWILPHGIPEITAICIAGAAGLILGRGMVAPRGLERRDALRAEAINAVKLLLGTLLLFVLAGFIEGTISQIHPPHLSVAFKIGFALTVGLGVYAYLFSAYLRGMRDAAA